MESQVRTLMPNFTIVALKCGPTTSKIAIFAINLPLRENFGGPQKMLNIGAQLQTFLYAIRPWLFWKLHCFIALPLAQPSSFQSVTKKTDKKHHTFSSSAGARPTIHTILGMVIEEVRTIFAPPNSFFTSEQQFRR